MKTLRIFTAILILFTFSNSFAQNYSTSNIIFPDLNLPKNELKVSNQNNIVAISTQISKEKFDSLYVEKKRKFLEKFDSISPQKIQAAEMKVQAAEMKVQEAKLAYLKAQSQYEAAQYEYKILLETQHQKEQYEKDPSNLEKIIIFSELQKRNFSNPYLYSYPKYK